MLEDFASTGLELDGAFISAGIVYRLMSSS